MFRKIAAGLIVLVFVFSSVTLVRYRTWRTDKLEELASDSQIIDTRAGKIEYLFSGDEGPVLLFVHGTPGGYDQAPDDYQGFRILAPSRSKRSVNPWSCSKRLAS